jgi:hypothetical protein
VRVVAQVEAGAHLAAARESKDKAIRLAGGMDLRSTSVAVLSMRLMREAVSRGPKTVLAVDRSYHLFHAILFGDGRGANSSR